MNLLILSVLAGAFTMAPPSVNVSGKWVMPAPGRAGSPDQIILVLNQVDGEVTGSITSSASLSNASPTYTEVLDGKVEGTAISFYKWEGRDQPVKVMYKGTVTGEQITFTVTGSPPSYNARGELIPPPGPRQVTAKRAR